MQARAIFIIVVGLLSEFVPSIQALRYTVHTKKLPFFEAWDQCIMNGGYLAATQTAFQNSEVWSVIRKAGVTGEVWLSGTQLGLQGSWIWLSRNTPVGRMSGYTNWYPGKPSNAANSGDNCLTIGVFNTAMWNDRQCTREYPYVCEYYAPYSYSFG